MANLLCVETLPEDLLSDDDGMPPDIFQRAPVAHNYTAPSPRFFMWDGLIGLNRASFLKYLQKSEATIQVILNETPTDFRKKRQVDATLFIRHALAQWNLYQTTCAMLRPATVTIMRSSPFTSLVYKTIHQLLDNRYSQPQDQYKILKSFDQDVEIYYKKMATIASGSGHQPKQEIILFLPDKLSKLHYGLHFRGYSWVSEKYLWTHYRLYRRLVELYPKLFSIVILNMGYENHGIEDYYFNLPIWTKEPLYSLEYNFIKTKPKPPPQKTLILAMIDGPMWTKKTDSLRLLNTMLQSRKLGRKIFWEVLEMDLPKMIADTFGSLQNFNKLEISSRQDFITKYYPQHWLAAVQLAIERGVRREVLGWVTVVVVKRSPISERIYELLHEVRSDATKMSGYLNDIIHTQIYSHTLPKLLEKYPTLQLHHFFTQSVSLETKRPNPGCLDISLLDCLHVDYFWQQSLMFDGLAIWLKQIWENLPIQQRNRVSQSTITVGVTYGDARDDTISWGVIQYAKTWFPDRFIDPPPKQAVMLSDYRYRI
jgi:hypothetical protein